MVKEFKDILQKGVVYLKNVEAMIDERIEKLKVAEETIDRIDYQLKKELSNVTKEGLSKIISFITQYFDDVKPNVEKLGQAQTMIADVVRQLRTDIKLFGVKDLKKQVEELEKVDFSQPFVPEVVKAPVSSPKTELKRPILAAPIPTIKSPVQEMPDMPETEDEEDWRESEIKGAKIYDTIITGWKRKDWEALKGNREMFIWGWGKLSSFDRKRIENGTWSKKIMNKLKLLGRERKT